MFLKMMCDYIGWIIPCPYDVPRTEGFYFIKPHTYHPTETNITTTKQTTVNRTVKA